MRHPADNQQPLLSSEIHQRFEFYQNEFF